MTAGGHHESGAARFSLGHQAVVETWLPTRRRAKRASTSLSAGSHDEGTDAILDQRTPHHLTGCLSPQHGARMGMPVVVLSSPYTCVTTSRALYGRQINECVHAINRTAARSSRLAPILSPCQCYRPMGY